MNTHKKEKSQKPQTNKTTTIMQQTAQQTEKKHINRTINTTMSITKRTDREQTEQKQINTKMQQIVQ